MRQARQLHSQVCGVHGRASSGFGQQVHLRPLSNPEPGGMLISPGRRVFRRLTKPHRLAWSPGSDQPTKPAGTAKPEPHRAPTVLPGGRACRARPGRLTRRRNGRRILHGPYDGIARAQAPGLDELGRLVVSRIQIVDGVTRTLTCTVIGRSRCRRPIPSRRSSPFAVTAASTRRRLRPWSRTHTAVPPPPPAAAAAEVHVRALSCCRGLMLL
jgi:hypothetical protein